MKLIMNRKKEKERWIGTLQLCNMRNSIIAEVQGDSILSPCAIAEPSIVGIGLRITTKVLTNGLCICTM